VEISVDGGFAGGAGRPLEGDPEADLAVMADAIQDFLGEEAKGDWPRCPRHRNRVMSARTNAAGIACWVCQADQPTNARSGSSRQKRQPCRGHRSPISERVGGFDRLAPSGRVMERSVRMEEWEETAKRPPDRTYQNPSGRFRKPGRYSPPTPRSRSGVFTAVPLTGGSYLRRP
jgi:hypothetical protein